MSVPQPYPPQHVSFSGEPLRLVDHLPKPMVKQVSSLNTLWLIQCLQTYHPHIDVHHIADETSKKGPFYIENLTTGLTEPVDLSHIEGTDYWFSNLFMMALYETIEQNIDDPDFAYRCGATFYKTQSKLKIAIGVPLIGPYQLIKKIVSENDKYNRTKVAEIRSLTKGHVVIRLIHKPNVIMKEFGMNWHRGIFESYARLAGVTEIRGNTICIEPGPDRFGDPGQAIYDFEFTFKDPGFRTRIWNRILYAFPTVKDLIDSAELIQTNHNEQIINRDKIIAERTNQLLSIQKRLMDAERTNIEKKLENLSAELITTEERERKAIAEDLHDSVTQLLALAVSNLKSFNKKNTDHLQTINAQKYIEAALVDTRSLTLQISPPVLYDFGLEAALEWLVSDICGRYPIEMDFINLLPLPLQLNDYQKVILYRATREAVINCIKHAQAESGSLVLFQESDKTVIEIEDNGIGFDPLNLKQGFGLSSLQGRLLNIGAMIDIVSSPGTGTRIIISM
jgi:signal transduction histidine kinase